jgi:hypothetical protein
MVGKQMPMGAHPNECIYQSFNEGMSFESFISAMPGSIYAGPVSGVMTWRSGQFNGLLRGTWAYTAP